MELTKQQLKQIIKEELEKVLKEDRWEYGGDIPSDQPSTRTRFNPYHFGGFNDLVQANPEALDKFRKNSTYKRSLQGLTCDEVVRKYDKMTDLAFNMATGTNIRKTPPEQKGLRIFEANLIWDARPDCFLSKVDVGGGKWEGSFPRRGIGLEEQALELKNNKMKLTKQQLKQIIKEKIENVLKEDFGDDERDIATRWEARETIKNIRGNDFIHPGQQFVVNYDETTEDARIIGVSIDINGNPSDKGYGQNPQWASGEAYKISTDDLDIGSRRAKARRMIGPHQDLRTGRIQFPTFRESVEKMKLTKSQLKQIIKEKLEEVYSEKQRKWACAQTGESRKKFKGKLTLSPKEAEEMCKDVDLKKAKDKK